MYQKGDYAKYVEKVQKLVDSGEIGKIEANIMLLGKVQQLIAQAGVSHKQFMMDRMGEAQYVN